jgi:hypothetical protein
MKLTKPILIIACVASLAISGCTQQEGHTTLRIISQDEAKVAVTINKDLSNTVINTNTGERIEPCKIDPQQLKQALNEIPESCYPEGYDPNGRILSEVKITVREGSQCITVVSASRYYVFCEPPHNLGF